MFRLKSVFVSLQRVVYVLVRLKKKKMMFWTSEEMIRSRLRGLLNKIGILDELK